MFDLDDRIAKFVDVMLVAVFLALIVVAMSLFGPLKAHAADPPPLSWDRVSIAAGVQWASDERVGDTSAPLLANRAEWGVAIPIAYNIGYPGAAKHPLALTYTPAFGFLNHQTRNTIRLSYVFKKGGS